MRTLGQQKESVTKAAATRTKTTTPGTKAIVQTKLSIGQPNDKYEQEADSVADQVVNSTPVQKADIQKRPSVPDQKGGTHKDLILQKMEEEEVQTKLFPSIMRMEEEEAQPKLQRMPDEELQTKQEKQSTQAAPQNIQARIQQSKGSGSPLSSSSRSFMESRIGADFSKVRIHNDSNAHKLSAKLNAQAFATGNDIFFNQGKYNPETRSGKHLLAHELTHTVQQGAAKEHLQRKALSRTSVNTIQRFAFLSGTQIDKNDPSLDPTMKTMASDTQARDYNSMQEFQDHAAGTTDYIGNLSTGTNPGLWVRFNPNGMNILGEYHTQVTLQDVAPAVNTTSFVRERFSTDNLSFYPELSAAYVQENQAQFQQMGIANQPDKRPYGGESLFPKIGYVFSYAFENNLFSLAKITDISAPRYIGKPLQRYLKLAWAWSKDNQTEITTAHAVGQSVIPQREALAQLHTGLPSQLDTFITGLQVDGYLGDSLGLPANIALLTPIEQFAQAFNEVIMEMAVTDPASRLSAADRTVLGSSSVGSNVQNRVFADWRNYLIEDTVNAAAANGVRYAGMGLGHLLYLQGAGLPSNSQAYDMVNSDFNRFNTHTNHLLNIAVP